MIFNFTLASMLCLFIMSPHPLNMMISTICITLILATQFKFLWNENFLLYMFILVMVSGLLIMFSYISSLCSTESFNFNFSVILFLILVILISNSYSKINSSKNISSLFSLSPSIMITLSSIYLIAFLVASINIAIQNKGPLKIQ